MHQNKPNAWSSMTDPSPNCYCFAYFQETKVCCVCFTWPYSSLDETKKLFWLKICKSNITIEELCDWNFGAVCFQIDRFERWRWHLVWYWQLISNRRNCLRIRLARNINRTYFSRKQYWSNKYIRMTAQPRISTNLLDIDVDSLFEQCSIHEIDLVHKKLQQSIEAKKEELRIMVG